MYRILLIILSTLITGWLVRPSASASSIHTCSYPEQLPGAYTGGFGEQTCRQCHFDYPINPDGGLLKIHGIPATYEPGKTYVLSIEVSREDLGKAGFQLSTRYTDSTQAGSFGIESKRVNFTKINGDIQYIQHSLEGTEPNRTNASAWRLNWTAPEQSRGDIVFNVAANAANNDASPFGDYIFTAEIISRRR